MQILIVGGGYLGRLLAHLLPQATVYDWRPKAPAVPDRSIGPQYLWRPIHGLTNYEFKVLTTVNGQQATDASILAYKQKVGKAQDGADWRAQFQFSMPGYEVEFGPDTVQYGWRLTHIDLLSRTARLECRTGGQFVPYDWLISTIPLPELLRCAGSTPVKPFTSAAIYVETTDCESLDHMSVNYLSDPANPVYRETFREGRCYRESLNPTVFQRTTARKLIPGKIYPHPDTADYLAMLRMARVLSVGRYGSWNPETLVHEAYEEVQQWKHVVLG